MEYLPPGPFDGDPVMCPGEPDRRRQRRGPWHYIRDHDPYQTAALCIKCGTPCTWSPHLRNWAADTPVILESPW